MIARDSPVGMFDSGVGGLTVLVELVRLVPGERYVYFADTAFAPYGEKSRAEILERAFLIADELINHSVKIMVVACNTATSSAIEDMRQRHSLPIVGMEPALKPAMLANLPGKILVLGTPFTIREAKYQNLLRRFGDKRKVESIPCRGLVELMEAGEIDTPEMNKRLDAILGDLPLAEFSAVVLGCTHFVFLKERLREIFGQGVKLFDGNLGTARQVVRVLKSRNLLTGRTGNFDMDRQLNILTSGDPARVVPLCKKLLIQLLG